MMQTTAFSKLGIWQYGVISPTEIVFDDEIRRICEGNTCRFYGKTWACPPALGTVAQCREKCLQYESAMIFTGKYQLADSFDYEGMMAGHAAFKIMCDKLYDLAKYEGTDFLLLSNEGCNRCQTCTYPESECRMPERLFPSLEGFGIYVKNLADAAHISYNNGTNTVTYFGMLLSNFSYVN